MPDGEKCPRLRFPLLAALFLVPGAVRAQNAAPKPQPPAKAGSEESLSQGMIQPDTELIDVPTAGVLDYGGYSSRTRFFSNGGVLEWLDFGVFQKLNLGASLNVDKLVGTGTPVQVTRPELQVKYRFYDGDQIIPAAAVGYDGQGYLYNRPAQAYNQRQRGLYLVGSQEIGVPGLQAHAGINISDFNSGAVYGEMAASYDIEDKVLLMAEWDSIHNVVDSRLNAGLRVYVTPAFNMDFDVRCIGQGGNFPNGVSRGPERIAMFKYTGNF